MSVGESLNGLGKTVRNLAIIGAIGIGAAVSQGAPLSEFFPKSWLHQDKQDQTTPNQPPVPESINGYTVLERSDEGIKVTLGHMVCGGKVTVEAHGGETIDQVTRDVTKLVGDAGQTWDEAPMQAPHQAAIEMSSPLNVTGVLKVDVPASVSEVCFYEP